MATEYAALGRRDDAQQRWKYKTCRADRSWCAPVVSAVSDNGTASR